MMKFIGMSALDSESFVIMAEDNATALALAYHLYNEPLTVSRLRIERDAIVA